MVNKLVMFLGIFILFIFAGIVIIITLAIIFPDSETSNQDETFMEKLMSIGSCKIVFTSDLHQVSIGEQGSELYCMDTDGSNIKRITDNNVFEFHADVSPKRDEIVTVTLLEEGKDKTGELDSNAELIIWDFEGNIVKRLTNNNRPESVPHWSPDGEKITFFAGNSVGNLNIYTINRDGTNEKKLTSGGVDVDPSYSPSGEIIFSRGNKIMIMDGDGDNLRVLVELDITPEDAIFVGSKIFFEANTGFFDIYSINKDGSNLKKLTDGDFHEAMPQPVGNKITYWTVGDKQAGTSIKIMSQDGSNQKDLISQITNSQMPTGNN